MSIGDAQLSESELPDADGPTRGTVTLQRGVTKHISLQYDSVAEINSRLVYASVSGYSDRGSWRYMMAPGAFG